MTDNTTWRRLEGMPPACRGEVGKVTDGGMQVVTDSPELDGRLCLFCRTVLEDVLAMVSNENGNDWLCYECAHRCVAALRERIDYGAMK